MTQDGAPLQLTDAVELGAHPLSTLLRVARGLEVELDEIGARFERILREGSKRP